MLLLTTGTWEHQPAKAAVEVRDEEGGEEEHQTEDGATR